MYTASVIFVVLYLLDIGIGYYLAGVGGAAFVAIALPIGILIQMKLALFQADAIRLENLSSHDKNRLALTFETVLQTAEQQGYTFRKNPRIFLSEDETLNGFSCGNAIVINRGLLNSGCLEGVVAHEVKHWRFHDSYCSCLICNTITVLSLLALCMLSVYVLAIALFIGIIVAIFGGGTAGFLAGSLVGRLLGGVKNLILKAGLFMMRALQGLLSRHTELKADEFSTRLGYGEQLKQFLRLTYERKNAMSISAQLLSTHPSDSKRIGNIQRIQNQMAENEEIVKLPFRV